MRLLIDINHPAHVHLFRNLIAELKSRGHKVTVTVKNIRSARELLDKYGIQYIDLGAKSEKFTGKLINQLKYDWRLKKIAKQNKIDIAIGTSVTIAHVSKLTGITSIVFDDDDSAVQPLMRYLGHPFADFLISPNVLAYERKKKNHLTYAGYHELAYLHPDRFTPDPSVLKDAGLNEGEAFFILRFNAFKAHHDIGVKGLSAENKHRLVQLLSKSGKVFITAEQELEPEFEQYRLKISADKVHSFICYATLLVGDSQTMTSEAAVLGTPSIRSNSFVGRISYLEEQEHKYGLTFGFLPDQTENMFRKISELLAINDLKSEWQKKRMKMLADKIDVTAFLIWLFENWPGSFKIMKETPEYQDRFR